MKVMGVDLGTVRTGVAIASTAVAQPLGVVEESDDDRIVERLAGIARDEGVAEIVVGLPVRLAGDEGPAAVRAREVARRLEADTRLTVHLWDERLTTAAAERVLLGGGVRRKKRRGVVDKVAATLLLQSYLDARTAKDRS